MIRAQFVERNTCISCGSCDLKELSTGLFNEAPLGDYLAADPWGECPLPYLDGQCWRYLQCRRCDQAFHGYVLSPEWNERRFSQWITQEAIAAFEAAINTPDTIFDQASQSIQHILRLEFLTRELRRGDRMRVLDFGCGYGKFVAMCDLYGLDAYGVDTSFARRDNAFSSRIVAQMDDLGERGTTKFHAITLFEVLEHLDDPKAILLSLSDYLSRGGILVLETPDCTGVESIRSPEDYRKIHPLEHFNGFTPSTLRRIAEHAGFEKIDKPVSHVTADFIRVAKSELRRVLATALPPTTQQYFRKL